MVPNFNPMCKAHYGLNCVPSTPNPYVEDLNTDTFGKAIILFTTGLTSGSQSTVIYLTLFWGCAHSLCTVSEVMDYTTGLLLTNTLKAREQTQNNWSLHESIVQL